MTSISNRISQIKPIKSIAQSIESKKNQSKRNLINQSKTMYIMHAYVTKQIHVVNKAMSLSYKQVIDIPVRLLELMPILNSRQL